MDVERATMMGRKAGLEEQLAKLKLQAEAACGTIRVSLNPALTPVEEMDIPTAAAEMDQLVGIYAEITGIRMQLAKINKALGE